MQVAGADINRLTNLITVEFNKLTHHKHPALSRRQVFKTYLVCNLHPLDLVEAERILLAAAAAIVKCANQLSAGGVDMF